MRDAGQVITVNGPVEPRQLGVTLTHEHLFIDLLRYFAPHPDPAIRGRLEGPLSIGMLGYLKRGYRANRDNNVIDDLDLAIAEARLFRDAGGGTICDLTSRGIRVDGHAGKLRAVAEATGLTVVCGTGAYVATFHGRFVRESSIDQLADAFVAEVDEGIGSTGIRAGIIGEIGLSVPVTPDEEKVLRAAGRAHVRTGAPIVVHQVDPAYRIPMWALDVLEHEEVNPNRVVIGHSGDDDQIERRIAVMRRGAHVAFDNIGFEGVLMGFEYPSDSDYVRRILRLVEAGFVDRLLLSQDVCKKTHLRRYGGFGYDHVMLDLRPDLLAAGLDPAAFDTMMIANPAYVLPLGR